MVTELVMTFKDNAGENQEFVYTLTSPPGMSVTGGQIFVENSFTSDLQRFSFRLDRDENDGTVKLVVLEEVDA